MEKIYTREYFVKQGRKGGQKTKKLYGIKHYMRISPRKKKIEKTVDKSLDNPLE